MSSERFSQIAEHFVDDPAVSQGTGFGASAGLRFAGRIFAMLVRDELVVKLPRSRVDALVAAGHATRFEPGTGKVMSEWASVPAGSPADWAMLAQEAHVFVAEARR